MGCRGGQRPNAPCPNEGFRQFRRRELHEGTTGYSPSVARSTDGKLWFLPWDGVSVIDPRHLPFNQLPPPVHFEQITADRKTYDATSNIAGHLRLPPIIRDEIYSIGREALVNAYRHSQGKSIEVEVEYAVNYLRILVRDDGCGIDPQILQSGRDGHWGLIGMRERAERIGARLDVRSRTMAGTEVELSVPGQIAFQFRSSNRLRGWVTSLYSRRAIPRKW